jgi:O-antigen/teichoic acid export membrane protein
MKHERGRTARWSGDATAAIGQVGHVKAAGVVALGMMAMNVLAYGFTILTAHVLGPEEFGGVSALLGLLIVAAVGSLAVQATAARRLATSAPQHQDAVIRDVLVSSAKLTIVLAVLFLALSPVIDNVLHLHDLVASATVGVCTVPITMMGAYAGITQGLRRWSALATIYTGLGAGRLVGGALAMLIEPSLRSAMIGLTVGSVVPLVIGMTQVRLPAVASDGDHEPVLRELWLNGHTLLAFFAFTNLDVLLARHLFNGTDAGIYAAGAILAKSCLFLPTFVLVVAFPTMATERAGRPWLRPLIAVLGLGALAVVAARVLPDVAVAFAGGSEYAELGHVAWLFALEGTMFAVLQILVYDTIAGQTHSASVLWLGAAVIAGLAIPFLDSVDGLVAVVSITAFAAGLVSSLMPGASHSD